ncbi:MAG: CCA tRNA nucleotidyltransferase [Armatimonadota bacterium]|nr:CCA tRNA nucleotidyltransferase [Armatimonadota bacterium]MDR7518215.1 CCA tRNA nucleotidyltransferase [Armatimonadota bacterium]MDR7550927.1 CCA tRNA nucleotidyltransferase [Armatimonadota bacterium]
MPARLRPGLAIVARLREAGWETYLVGGVVRDLLLGRIPADLDIVTAAPPEVVASCFDRTVPVGAEFGVVAVIVDGHPYQVATFRTEGPYLDGRRPASVASADAASDVLRRDFTINALLYDPAANEVIDHVGGLPDLERRVIRTVGDPTVRFAEDRLRLLRAVRLGAELGFSIEEGTLQALGALAQTVTSVSRERIRDELVRLLVAPGRAEGVRVLQQTGLLAAVLPEVAGPEEVARACRTLHRLTRPSPMLAVAALLLPVGSAERATAICRRLRFSNVEVRAVAGLVAGYGRVPEIPTMRAGALKTLLDRVDPADLLELYRVETAARGGDLAAYRRAAEALVARSGVRRPALGLLSGDDLMALGYRPGPGFSAILEAVEEARARGEIVTRDEARAWVLARWPAGAPPPLAEGSRRLRSGPG